MNADVDGDVYCNPTVCVAYPPKSNTPAVSPTRISRRRSSPRRRAMAIANGPSTASATKNRSTRYANGVTSLSASWTRGKVTPNRNAAATSAPSAAKRLTGLPSRPRSALGRSAGPAVREREASVLPERLRRDPHTGRRLTPLVLVAVDEARDPGDRRGIVALGDEVGDRLVVFDVALEDRVELRVLRKRVAVAL